MTAYSYSIPSREAILAMLRAAKAPLTLDALSERMSLDISQQEGFLRRLAAMEQDGQIKNDTENGYIAADTSQFIAGRVQGHRDGFGFLIRDDGQSDLFLPFQEMQKAMHNDRVLVRPLGYDRRGRLEARIVEITEHGNRRVVGRVFNDEGQWFVTPEDQRLRQDILLTPECVKKVTVGQIVHVELLSFPGRRILPVGEVVEILGEAEDSGMEIEIAVRKYGVPSVFSKAALAQAEALPETVGPADHAGRKDLRALPFVTIDGEDARDFDDAVYGEYLSESDEPSSDGAKTGDKAKTAQGKRKVPEKRFKLYVAIADVAHYVRPNDALDRDAVERSTSVYFPRRVIPMLPEKLSNGLCSLNPHVDRCALVCEMIIDAQGHVQSHQFYPALIHSAARLTYTQVAQVLEPLDEAAPHTLENSAVLLPLQTLYQIYHILIKARQKRGAIEFDTTETKIICNPLGKIEQIIPSVRNVAHKLIEECMLAANVCAAQTLQQHKHPGLYRVHASPDLEKIVNLRRFLGLLGLTLGGGDTPTATDYAVLMDQARAHAQLPEAVVDLSILQTMLLRSMQQAVYSPDNIGHFGLAYGEYAHFTSPIRRYPDLLTHRALYAILNGQKYHPQYTPEIALNTSMVALTAPKRVSKAETPSLDTPKRGPAVSTNPSSTSAKNAIWYALGQHCSANERRADEASRDVESWLKCYFMRDKVGEIYTGAVSGVTAFGLFVQLDTLFIDGLVHITELGSDYFEYDAIKNELVGERTGVRYRLSDRLTVQVARVDLSARKIDFRLIGALSQPNQSKKKGAAPASTKKRTKKAEATEQNPDIESKKSSAAKVQKKTKADSKKITPKTSKKASKTTLKPKTKAKATTKAKTKKTKTSKAATTTLTKETKNKAIP